MDRLSDLLLAGDFAVSPVGLICQQLPSVDALLNPSGIEDDLDLLARILSI